MMQNINHGLFGIGRKVYYTMRNTDGKLAAMQRFTNTGQQPYVHKYNETWPHIYYMDTIVNI